MANVCRSCLTSAMLLKKRIPGLARVLSTAVVAFIPATPAPGEVKPPTTNIRTEAVLIVGPVRVSRYAVQKNLDRYRRSVDGKEPLSAAALRTWFERYLVQQVIIAEALTRGYGARPEIIGVVKAMEYWMLAQLAEAASSPGNSGRQSVYTQSSGGDPIPAFVDMMHEGSLSVQGKQMRASEVKTANILVSNDVAKRLVSRVRGKALPPAGVADEWLSDINGQVLATYQLDGQKEILTIDDWKTRFNRLFVRILPQEPSQLERSVQDLVVMECRYREARQRGLDRAPQFVEDRLNFLYYQALDLFEKEQLLPRIELSSAEVSAYYLSHQSQFNRPARAYGKLFFFNDEAAAIAWLRAASHAAMDTGQETEVSRQLPLSGAERATELILRMEAGRAFGPIHTPSGVMIFFKQSGDTEQLPYSAVDQSIRAALSNEAIEHLEVKLAQEWAPRYLVEDNLDAKEFGIAEPIDRPWSKKG